MIEKYKRQKKRRKTFKQSNLYKLLTINPILGLFKSIENNQESTKFVNNLFWVFNSILIFFLIINEFFGGFFVPVIHHLSKGYSIANVAFYSLFLYLVVLFAVIVGIKLKEKPVFKLKFLLGLEIPVLILVIIRQEMLYELNMPMKYLFLLFFVWILIYWIQVYFFSNKTNSKFQPFLKMRKLLLFAFAIYFSGLFIFTTIPLGIVLLKNSLLNFRIIEDLYLLGYLLINLLVIFILVLVLNPALYTFRHSVKKIMHTINQFNLKKKISYLLPGIVLFSALYFLNIDNREYTYLALKNEPSLIKQKEFFFNNKEKLKKELHQTDSLQYYYLGSVQNNFFCQILGDDLDLNNTQKKVLQYAYNLFMYPFFYQDIEKVEHEIVYKAEKIYNQLFDEPINEYSYYYDHWASYADVHIDQQEINITEYGDIAEIEICESYSTESNRAEEIIARFTLPFNSVITGLWISDDKNMDKKYPGLVAPSGAAEKVYLNEVRKQVDPALLSQIGSNEYLLRAFPIISKEISPIDSVFDYKSKNDYQFRLWFRYKTFISKDRNWVLPKLQYNRNVNWSDETKTFVNGKTYDRPNSWLPEYVKATKPTWIKEHATAISDTVRISSKPIEPHEWTHFNENIAFIIDGSYSMNEKRQELFGRLGEIKEMFPNFKELDCFLIGEEINKLKAGNLLDELDSNPQLFFGNTNYMDMLEKFTAKFNEYTNKYKSIILISDILEYRYPLDGIFWDYSSELEYPDTLKPIKLGCPFIVIQLSDENFIVEPNDFFNQLVYHSNGGFPRNKYELFNLIYTNNTYVDSLLAYQDGIAYFKSKIPASTDSLFKDFAIKEFINHYELGDSTKLVDIDILNEMAKKEQIITKYSSMVALVNQEQVDSLKSAETHLDRYNHFRESNSSGDGVMGLLNMFGYSVPKHSENMVVFIFLLLVCVMIFADRLR